MSRLLLPFFVLVLSLGLGIKVSDLKCCDAPAGSKQQAVSKEGNEKNRKIKTRKSTQSKGGLSKLPEQTKTDATIFGQAVETPATSEATDVFLPIVVNDRNTGEDQVRIRTSSEGKIELDQINTEILINHLQDILTQDSIDGIKKKLVNRFSSSQELEEAQISSSYDMTIGGISLSVPKDWVKASIINMEFYKDTSMTPNLDPDFISGYVNVRGYKRYSQESPGQPIKDQDVFNYDGVITSMGATLQGGGIIEDDKARRKETSLVVPWNNGRNMILLGDGKYTNITTINTPELSGAYFYNKATLKRHHQEIDGGSIELKHKSSIEIYRNEQLFRTLKADAGNFYISNLPLQVGQNVIRIVIKDEVTGEKTEKIIEDYLPLYSVPKGEIEAAVAQGVARKDAENGFEYYGEPITFAGIMYGVTSTWNSGASSYKQDDYSRVGFDQRLVTNFGNLSFLFQKSETKNQFWGTSGTGSFSGSVRNPKLVRNYSASYERAGAGYEAAPKGKNLGYTKTRLNAGLVPFLNISTTMTYESTAEEGAIDDSFIVSINRSFKLSKNWSGSVSMSQVWGTGKSEEGRVGLSLTYSENIGSARFSAAAESNRDGERQSMRIQKHGAFHYSASMVNNEQKDKSAEASIGQDFSKGKLNARFNSSELGKRQGAEIQAETAIAFTNRGYAFSTPLSDSFLIFESQAERGVEFEILNSNAKAIADNGSFWNSVVIPVRNFSTVELTAGYTDPSYFTMESSKNIIYRAEYRAGAHKYLSSDDKVLAMLRVVDQDHQPVLNALGKVVCKNPTDVFYDSVFTNTSGDTEFYARRGASCQLVFGKFSTEFLDLSWPSKYKDFGNIQIK